MKEVVLEGYVSGHLVMPLTQEQRVVQRKIYVFMPANGWIKGFPGQQGRLGHRSVAGLQHQVVIINAVNGIGDVARPQANFRNTFDFLYHQFRRCRQAVAAKYDQAIWSFRNRDGKRPDKTPRPFEVLLKIRLQRFQPGFTRFFLRDNFPAVVTNH